MTKQVINTGSAANDGTGDTLRTAATKINSNFTELYNDVASITGNTAISTTAQSAFDKANSANTLAQSAYNQANTGTTIAQAAFNFANTIVSDTQVDPYARTTSNTASNNITLIQGVDVAQNTRMSLIEGVNVTQNTNITNITNTSTSGFLHANSAYESQNTTGTYANSAFLKANTPSHVANSAALYANGAFSKANAAYTQANTATTNASTADSKSVSAGSYANAAFLQANTATTDAATADGKAVTSGSYANSAYTQANTATTLAQEAFNAANSASSSSIDTAARTTANAAFDKANTTPTGVANSSYSLKLNDAGILSLEYNNTTDLRFNSSGLTSYGQFSIESANSTSGNNSTILFDRNGSGIAFRLEDNTPVSKSWGFYQTNVLFPDETRQYTAFTGYATDNTARTTATSGFVQANAAYTQANTATTNAATADSKAVSAGSYANSAYTQANTATTTAQAAFNAANTAGSPNVSALTGLGTGVSTFLATPTSANLLAAVTNETGTGSLVFATAPTISLPVIDNIKQGYSTTATAAGTTTLTVNSNRVQFFTGTTTQVLSLPAPQTMTLGMEFLIVNNSTGSVEVRAANAATVATVLPGTAVSCISIDLTAGNGAAGWNAEFVGFSSVTGTGSVVLSASPTFTGTVTGTAATSTVSSTASSLGYLGIPQSATATTATLAIGDAGKHIYVTTDGQTITIPANASVAYPIGTTIGFIAGPSATTVTIAITSDTMYLAGTGTTGSRTLAAHGMATAVKVAATTWYISGNGLT
jgi:hypothetical protein